MATLNQNRGAPSVTDNSLIDIGIVAKLLPKKDNLVGKVKVKKPIAKPREDNAASPPSSPLLNNIDSALRATFASGRPMDDLNPMIQCKHCRKPMLGSVAHSHIKLCLQKKNERAQRKKEQKEANRKAREAREKAGRAEEDATQDAEGDEDSVNGDKGMTTGKKSAVKASTSTSKKRKADEDSDKAPTKKKTKKEIEAAKPKVPKPKGPVDVEKQCGVLLANGAMCARSLTCKSHAMGAKRGVPGRSLPYDMLLQAYQKKNQAKQQKAAIDANAPLLDDFTDPSGPIDSDDERDQVMAAIARSRPRPLAEHIHVPMRAKYNYIRMKEMLSTALGAGRGGNMYGNAGMVAPNAPTEGMDGDPTRRASLVQPGSARGFGPGTGLSAPVRKSSVVGAPAAPTPVASSS